MIDLRDIPEDELGQTQKQTRRHIIKRGWKARIPYVGSSHYFITRDDGKELHIFSSTPPTTSYAAGLLANDKFATYQLLKEKENTVPQLDTIKVDEGDNLDKALEFLKGNGVVVVKPIDGGHGNGITLNVTNESELRIAIENALKATVQARSILIQKQYSHKTIYDIRILCIDYKYVAGIQRLAARVFGDGVHTVRELIEQENAKERRGKAYVTELASIDLGRVELYLGPKINDIPPTAQEVQVLGIANYGAGGETNDVTNSLPDWLIKYAEQVAKVCELPVVGVDFMLAELPEKDLSQAELDPILTETNKAPLITMHDTPTYGVSRNAMDRYMDYLGSIR